MNQISMIEGAGSGRMTKDERNRLYEARNAVLREMWLAGEPDEAILAVVNQMPVQTLTAKDIPLFVKYVLKLGDRPVPTNRAKLAADRATLQANIKLAEEADREESRFYYNKVREADERRKAKREAKLGSQLKTEPASVCSPIDEPPTLYVEVYEPVVKLLPEIELESPIHIVAPPPPKLLNSPSTATPSPVIPDLVITGKDSFRRTPLSPSAVITHERSKAIERLTSVRVLGPALPCQTVTNQGQYGVGIEFCGKPTRIEADGTRKYSYCLECHALFYRRVSGFRAPPWA